MTDKDKKKSPDELAALYTEALKRITAKKPMGKEDPQKPLMARLTAIKDKPEIKEEPRIKPKGKELGLSDMAKLGNELDKKTKEKGIDIKSPNSKDLKKDDKDKDKEKENTPEKQEQKMKEMFSKIKLPSGMEVHQEGPAYVLVSKDGKVRTDITDIMNSIDKFNHGVDAANEQNHVQNNAQQTATNQPAQEDNDPTAKENEVPVEAKVEAVATALPNIKDVNGAPMFEPEDVKAIAEIGISASIEKGILEDLNKRGKNNENTAEKKDQTRARNMILRQNARDGR